MVEGDSIGLTLYVSWTTDSFQHFHPFERVKVEEWVPFWFSSQTSLRRSEVVWIGSIYRVLWEECIWQLESLGVSVLPVQGWIPFGLHPLPVERKGMVALEGQGMETFEVHPPLAEEHGKEI